jgi:hypothetical protein
MPSNSKISEEYLEVQEKTSTTIPKAMNIEQIIEPFPGGEQVVIEISTSTTEMIPHTIQENDTLTEIVPEMLPETVPETMPEILPQTSPDETQKTRQETVSETEKLPETNVSSTIKSTTTEDQKHKIPSSEFLQSKILEETSTVSKEIIPINGRTERTASITSTEAFFPNAVTKSVPISALTMLVPPTLHLSLREKFVVSVEKSEILEQDGSTIMDHPWDPEQNLTLIPDQSTQLETVTLSAPFIANPNIERKQNQRPRTPKAYQDTKSPKNDAVSLIFPQTIIIDA